MGSIALSHSLFKLCSNDKVKIAFIVRLNNVQPQDNPEALKHTEMKQGII